MAGRRLAIPPVDELVKIAPDHTSIASIAHALGFKPNSLVTRLRQEDPEGRVAAALGTLTGGEAVSREEILEQRVKELERAQRTTRKADVLEQRVLDAITAAVEERTPSYKPIKRRAKDRGEHEMLLLWSDTHAGEVVSADEMNGLNSYDWATMWRRHDRLREALHSFVRNRPYQVRRLHVAMLGDMVGGEIHEELARTNEMPVADVAVQFGLDGAAWLESLAEGFESVSLTGVVGNHGRLTKKPAAKKAYANWDRVAYRVMAKALAADGRFTFDIPDSSAAPFEVCGRTLLAWHGDGVRSTMPGVPWGGVQRRAAALRNSYREQGLDIEMFCVGHFHTLNVVQGTGGWVAMNGSVKGADEYSLKSFGSAIRPQQLLLTFHPEHGLTDASVLDLGER